MWCRKMIRDEVGKNIGGSFTKDYECHFKTVGYKHGEISKKMVSHRQWEVSERRCPYFMRTSVATLGNMG